MTKFIQIPGPNPILMRGQRGTWDEKWIECCDVLKDDQTYYLYYHGEPLDVKAWPRAGYQIGVATAPHPLGPWTKHEKSPILALGPEGTWEDENVACASVIKEGTDTYYMWYSGLSKTSKTWSIGLATASDPLGPWRKHKSNPVVEDFGYVGGVVNVGGTYYMYAEHPIGSAGPDYGPIELATAERPQGPWTKYQGNPVLPSGSWGAWDDGGYSEAKVTHRDGLFHIFYGGAKLHRTRLRSQESIGYAYSSDGRTFTKYTCNPVALRERNPDCSAFSEVHSLFEPPFVYLYHTLRYVSKPNVEDIGVQVLATSARFRLAIPVATVPKLGAGATTSLDTCPPVGLAGLGDAAMTFQCTYDADARSGMRAHVRSSCDGLTYDTEDLYTFDLPARPGGTLCKTVSVAAKVMYVKILLENLDKARDITGVKVTATLGC